MPLKKSAIFLTALFLGVAMIAAACGSSDGEEVSSSGDNSTTTAASTAPPDAVDDGGFPAVIVPSDDGGRPALDDGGSAIYDAPGALQINLPLDATLPPGTILDSEKLNLGDDAVGYRILYSSLSIRDEPIAVSGYVVTPSGTPPAGGWPLIAWAHGTEGMGDDCAPSAAVETDTRVWAGLVDEGYAVVATDFEGLGTPGLHPYIVGGSAARGVFDSVRAVQNSELTNAGLTDISVSDEWVVWGHSQGGHAVVHVSQRWQGYAPELKLLGAVAGAPPSQLNLIFDALLGGDFQGYIAMAVASVSEAYEDANADDILGPRAVELLPVMEEGCLQDIFDAYNPLPPEEISKIGNPTTDPKWNGYIVENDSNAKAPQAPLLIIHGSEDEQIPTVSSLALLGQLCAFGDRAIVQRVVYEGYNHSGVIEPSTDDMLSWFKDRFDGVPLEAGTSSFPSGVSATAC